MSNESEIVPYQRIEELEYFYTSDSVKNDSVIEIVDVKEKKLFSEEVQGQWALEQIEAVMDILRVRMFVIPKDKGGYDLPIIQTRGEYLRSHLLAKQRGLDNFSNSQDSREAYIQVLYEKMEEEILFSNNQLILKWMRMKKKKLFLIGMIAQLKLVKNS